MVEILAEIVGGYNLKRSVVESDTNGDDDGDSMRPYCTVQLGSKIIHQTKKAEGGRNPVWTVSTGSFFLVDVSEEDLESAVLKVSVWFKQKDSLQLTVLDTFCLGQVQKSVSEIFLHHCDEGRLEMDLCDPKSKEPSCQGSVTLRFRLSTSHDKRFLSLLKSEPKLLKQKSIQQTRGSADLDTTQSSLLVTEANETEVAGVSFMNVLSSALTTKSYVDQTSGKTMVLVKPHPDPDCADNTTYLSKGELTSETLAPSKQWVEAGSGDIGKVFVEILSCHNLPNLDVGGEAMGNVTDAFVCAVFEDAMVQTPVIDDELSPHWLPWTSRAFVFRMMHPSSNLYLAAFDFDLGISSHDPIGRVAVNLANLQPDTEYTLKYNLFPSSNVTDRTAAGRITLRVRVEYNDQKRALLETLKPIPKFHINVRKEKSLAVLRYTCFGEYGDDTDQEFDLTVVRSYINEILEYKTALAYYFGDAFRSLMFWRGQVRVGTVLLPLHSLLFYLSASTLVERPYLFPSFFLLAAAWILISNQLERTQHPSPWYQCRPLLHYVDVLRNRQSTLSDCNIDPHHGAKDAEAYEVAWRERLEKDQELAAQQAAMQQEIMDIGDETIQTKTAGMIPLDLLVRLARYQGIVGQICKKFRMVKIVLTWEDNYKSFWITAGFLGAGLVSLLLPWSFILLWTGRLFVWGLFGPHMKFIDLIMRANSADNGDLLQKAIDKFKKESVGARIRRQEAVKLRDFKFLCFGKYITLVPSYNLSRHFDRPLPESFARKYSKSELVVAPRGVPGQQLFGTVLPRTEHENALFEVEMADVRDTHTILQKKLIASHVDENDDERNETGSFCESISEKNAEVSINASPSDEVDQRTLHVNKREHGAFLNSEAGEVDRMGSSCFSIHSEKTTERGNRRQEWGNEEVSSEACLSPSKDVFDSHLKSESSGILQIDEERELDGVEIVLGPSYLDDDYGCSGRQQDDDSAGGLSSTSEAASCVIYYQPSKSSL